MNELGIYTKHLKQCSAETPCLLENRSSQDTDALYLDKTPPVSGRAFTHLVMGAKLQGRLWLDPLSLRMRQARLQPSQQVPYDQLRSLPTISHL